SLIISFFALNAPSSPVTYTLSLHDALPICCCCVGACVREDWPAPDKGQTVRSSTASKKRSISSSWTECVLNARRTSGPTRIKDRSEEHTSELQSRENLVCRLLLEKKKKEEK